jgi:solute carrier family 25 uncoupling protein 8/9
VDVSARIMAGLTTGAMAVMVAQPTDIVKVRFQAQLRNDVQLAPHKIYTGTWMAYRTIFATEGIRGLWRGKIS